jgi:hypothetical protein
MGKQNKFPHVYNYMVNLCARGRVSRLERGRAPRAQATAPHTSTYCRATKPYSYRPGMCNANGQLPPALRQSDASPPADHLHGMNCCPPLEPLAARLPARPTPTHYPTSATTNGVPRISCARCAELQLRFPTPLTIQSKGAPTLLGRVMARNRASQMSHPLPRRAIFSWPVVASCSSLVRNLLIRRSVPTSRGGGLPDLKTGARAAGRPEAAAAPPPARSPHRTLPPAEEPAGCPGGARADDAGLRALQRKALSPHG